MIDVRLRVPGTEKTEEITLKPGEAILVGRRPDWSKMGRSLIPKRATERAVAIDEPRVSQNHLLLVAERDHTILRDLESRNGTRLSLDGHAAVTIQAPRTLVLDLAPPADAPAEVPLQDATWATEEDFDRSVAAEVEAYLRRTHPGVSVRVVSDDDGRAREGAVEVIPLREDKLLRFDDASDGRTRGMALLVVLTALHGYVGRQRARLQAEQGHRGLFMASPAFRRAHEQVVAAAQARSAVHFVGEPGTGKARLAECYAQHGGMENAPFEPIDCSSPDAPNNLPAALEAAAGGVLFLRRIDRLPLDAQRRLADHIDRAMRRSGAALPRIASSTWAPLEQLGKEEDFLLALYLRLVASATKVEIPPLRERPEDVRALLRGTPAHDGTAGAYDRLTSDARVFLEGHAWPGNFRALEAFAACLRDLPQGPIDLAVVEPILRRVTGTVDTVPPVPPEAAVAGSAGVPDAAILRAYSLAVKLLATGAAGLRAGAKFKERQACVERMAKAIVAGEKLKAMHCDVSEPRERWQRTPAGRNRRAEAAAMLGIGLGPLQTWVDLYNEITPYLKAMEG